MGVALYLPLLKEWIAKRLQMGSWMYVFNFLGSPAVRKKDEKCKK
jgi:hypothetical protein